MFIDTSGDFVSQTFDFVIIGGGTAGLALAARLFEDPDTTVSFLKLAKTESLNPIS
jgi:succinate dehydrogenase/fumarate reductase flavoprotein subunit